MAVLEVCSCTVCEVRVAVLEVCSCTVCEVRVAVLEVCSCTVCEVRWVPVKAGTQERGTERGTEVRRFVSAVAFASCVLY